MGKKDALIKRLTLHPLMCWDIGFRGIRDIISPIRLGQLRKNEKEAPLEREF